MRCLCLAFLVAAAVSRVCADPAPDLPQSRVTLTYPEFRALLDAVNAVNKPKAETPPPVVLSADYELDLGDASAVVQARWRVESMTAERQLTPLCPANVQLLADADSKTAWVRQGDTLAVLTREAGVHDIRATFVNSSGSASGETIQFPILLAPTNLLKLRNIPSGYRFRVDGASPLPAPEGELHFALSAPEVVIHRLAFQTRLVAGLLDGDGRELRIPLPDDLRALRVESPDGTYQLDPAESLLIMRWENGSASERVVVLSYHIPLAFDATEWPLPAPAPTEPGAQNLFAIRSPASLEISGSTVGDPRTSDWLRGQIKNQNVALIQSREAVASVTARTLPLAETATLIAKTADYHTRVVADGSIITDVRVELENESSTRWEFSLPPGGQLLNCASNGRSVRPIQRPRSLEIPLNPSESKTVITFSFTTKLDALSPVAGAITIPLPITPTFIHTLNWTLAIPDAYEVAGIESQAGVVPATDKRELRLRQELVRGAQIAADLHYRKRGLQP